MENKKDEVSAVRIMEFFRHYSTHFNEALLQDHPDVQPTTDSFAEYFVEASPQAVHGGSNGNDFREMVKKGFAQYRQMGIQLMKIVKQEVTFLNGLHAMVRVQWQSTYLKDGVSHDIPFEVIYFVQLKDSTCKIFAYITGDEHKALKERGLMA
jgi:hypothetical protein